MCGFWNCSLHEIFITSLFCETDWHISAQFEYEFELESSKIFHTSARALCVFLDLVRTRRR